MRWVLTGLAVACGIGLLLLVYSVRGGGSSRADHDQPADPVPPAGAPGRDPAPASGRAGPPSPRPEVAGEPAPPPALSPVDAALFERIEKVDAPRELHRIAGECEAAGVPLAGRVIVAFTLVTGGGQARVEQLSMKGGSLAPEARRCVKERLATARWDQDAPERSWRFGVPLGFAAAPAADQPAPAPE